MVENLTDDSPKDACGVFGVWAPGEEVSKLAYYGLFSLQHRGQESAGIATSAGERIAVYKDVGLVSQVFDEATLSSLTGHIAIGHCRYGSHAADDWLFAQPTLGATSDDGTVALGFNGALTNREEVKALITERYGEVDSGELAQGNTSDTALITTLLRGQNGDSLEDTAAEVFGKLQGAFSVVMMSENTLYAVRDRHGFRPLVLGRLTSGWVIASEQSALATTGATFIREVAPGEILAIDADGVRSTRFAASELARCIFEYVYIARPDAAINGRSVYESRLEMGRQLARENTAEADVVIPVPDSGTPAAIGYAEESGIPLGHGFVKNSYVGRTFIKPSQTLRQLGIRLKLNVQPSVVAGKSVIVVDDSIVRGNTQRQVVAMLRSAGAREVHVKISSPPVKWPCFYGIDFATRAELIATGAGIEEIRAHIAADSLAYISLEGTIAATQQDEETLCTACFSGNYPTEVPMLTTDRK
ncbi:amidophosphoribosyltransferase [Enteractinococcus helveticum]|uniref:amidophosphoribosyltransferase n=1 Tax=Enteractinococcus helveticum TaxID=1837282 RepID=UPI0009EEB46A|nr:amidophosphoribosyltransferase [Enteractinococcus helveticum]